MSQYVFVLLWFIPLAVLNEIIYKSNRLANGQDEKKVGWLFALVAIIPVVLIVGFRPDFFGDTAAYIRKFDNAPTELNDINGYLDLMGKDKGFYIFLSLIKIFITKNYIVFFIIVASLQGIALVSVYRKYSSHFVFSLFLFIVSADYLLWMFNGSRQFCAVAIIFAATPLLLKKKYIRLILIVLLASTFHQSALLMLPIVFIVRGKPWNKKTLFFIGFVLLAIIFIDNFTDILNNSLVDTQYSDVVSEYTSEGDNGTNPIRVLVYSVPTILAIFGRKKIKEQNSDILNICVNMSIISTGLYIISIFTSGMYLGRLPIYCSLYNYILLPWEIDLLFNERDQKTVSFFVIVFYIAYYIYQTHFVWDLI